jgi:hypothetical protein
LFFLKKLEGEERKRAIEDPGKSWRQWATQNYFRYGGELNLIFTLLSVLALIPMIYIEYLIYKRLFPERF